MALLSQLQEVSYYDTFCFLSNFFIRHADSVNAIVDIRQQFDYCSKALY